MRATEYTAGINGPKAMPAELPLASAYTYAVDLSADSAIAAGATTVRLSQPVFLYVDNFLNFPVGTRLPLGYYDPARSAWIPSQNGRVVKILNTSGGIAAIDADGDSTADDSASLASLGFTDLERRQLAATYSAGKVLWRSPISHLSPWDTNFPQSLPGDAIVPDPDSASGGAGGGSGGKHKDADKSCEQQGSIIECENQTLGERVGIVGTPFSLNYRSSRVPGRTTSTRVIIPLSGPSVPSSLVKIRLLIKVAGQQFEDSFPATANQQTVFDWDGKDAYGRVVQGVQLVTIYIGYVYGSTYRTPAAGDTSFGRPGGSPLTGDSTRVRNTIQRFQQTAVGTWDSRGVGLGGWSLDVHHSYDPIGRVLYLGDGSSRTAQTLGQTIRKVAGKIANSFGGDSGSASVASFRGPNGVAAGPDGSVYIADSFNHRVRRIGPDGVIHTIVGNGSTGSTGDGGPATAAELNAPADVAIGPDGSLYITDFDGSRIRRVDTNGIITTVAGTGTDGNTGDGGPATGAEISEPYGLAVGGDGSVYFTEFDSSRVRRVGPDGIIATVAGTGVSGFNGDSIPATTAELGRPIGLALGPDGLLYIADQGNSRVRRISAEGIITTVAGTGVFGFSGDGGAATSAKLAYPFAVAFANDGGMFIADYVNYLVRRVGPDGVITTIAGTGNDTPSGDGGTPLQAGVDPSTMAVTPNGDLYFGDPDHDQVWVITPTLPGVGEGDVLLASEDGGEIYRFDYQGRHLRTLDALTGSTRYNFAYDSAGRLATVADRNGNVTTVERDSDGTPTAIVAPFGQQTSIAVDSNGYIEVVANPAGESVHLTQSASGLLATRTDPVGGVSKYVYDSVGRLVTDSNAAGGAKIVTRTESDTAYTIALTTALGRTTKYMVQPLASGNATKRIFFDAAGLATATTITDDGATQSTSPDGTVSRAVAAADPRFGIHAPVLESLTVQLPSGLSSIIRRVRVDSLSDPNNPLRKLCTSESCASA
jgi:YD repeat-containing protein